MLSNKSFTAGSYEVLKIAYGNYLQCNRPMTTLDIMVGIVNDVGSPAARILIDYGIIHGTINGYYNHLVAHYAAENFSLDRFCLEANDIARIFESNVICPEHMMLAILSDSTCYANRYLVGSNINLLETESHLVELMGRPGFIYSYLRKEDFWSKHFYRWTKANPHTNSKSWRKLECNSIFARSTPDGECGLIIKDSGGEFIIEASVENNSKALTVTAKPTHVSAVQTAFMAYALGRLSFQGGK